MKELLQELCDSFQKASSHKIELRQTTLFVEIWIDGNCIARQHLGSADPDAASLILIKEIFNNGIIHLYSFYEKKPSH